MADEVPDLANLLRMNRLPEAWIAPPPVRELRHHATLVALRTSVKNQLHAVLAAAGVPVSMSEVFGVEGATLLDRVPLATTQRARLDSGRRLPDQEQKREARGLRCRNLRARAQHADCTALQLERV